MTEESSGQLKPPTKQAGLWADFALIVVHAIAAGYVVWVFVTMIPQYKQLCVDFEVNIPPAAVFFINISDSFITHVWLVGPALVVCFVILELISLKMSENTTWRKIWLLGFILLPLGFAAWVQALFFYVLNQAMVA